MSTDQKRKAVIAGGTGFLGLNLAQYLTQKNWEVLLLSRHKPKENLPYRHQVWDGRSLGKWADELEEATALINLAGRTVDCIKTPANCDEILRSRVEATAVLGKAVRVVNNPPPVWVQMSTAHIYGDPPKAVCDEDSAFGYGLAPTVGKAWEETFAEAALPDQRKVILRTSFVIGKEGGALPRLAKLTRMGFGGKIGSGKQGMSWIHEEDMSRLFYSAMTDENMKGAYLATAPNPVSQKEFMKELRKALKAPIGLPATSWMAKIGAPLFLKTDPELALYGRYCVSKRLEEEGFEFSFPQLKQAMAAIYTRH